MMSDNAHERALRLIAQARVEGLPVTDSGWLHAHLEDCDFCAEHARQTDQALRVLRTAAIPLPAGLASRTQFRVRLRAEELREHGRGQKLLCARKSCANTAGDKNFCGPSQAFPGRLESRAPPGYGVRLSGWDSGPARRSCSGKRAS